MINDDFIANIKPEYEPKNLYVKKGDKTYKITIILHLDYISLNISELYKLSQTYVIKLNLKQIKAKHISFSKILSLEEFKNIVIDNIDKKAINITKISEYIIRFELTKYSVHFGLTKKKISNNEILENINIRMEKYEQKLFELEIIKKLKQEIDEIKKKCEILNEENKKLQKKNIEKEKEKEINDKNKELLDLKQELKEIKTYIEKFKIDEVKPLWSKKFSFRYEKEKRKKIEIICKDMNNIISENEEKNGNDIFNENISHYKIDIFAEKDNSIGKKRGRNNNSKTRYDFFGNRNIKRYLTERKSNIKSLENISEESDKSNSFQERNQTDYNIKENENNNYYEKILINKKIFTKKIQKFEFDKRLKKYNIIGNTLSRNNSSKFKTPTKLNDRSSYSEQKKIHNQ